MNRWIGLLFIFFLVTAQAIEPLPLTENQIEKLKAYFPQRKNINTLRWQGEALNITLPLNQEKRLIFPSSVTVDVKGALTSDQLLIVNNNRSVYLTALKDFPKTRLYITLANSKAVAFIDIEPSTQADNATLTIDVPKNTNTFNESFSKKDTWVALTRYVWQQLYASKTVRQNQSDIKRVPMQTSRFITNLIYGHGVIAHPVASWVLNGFYLTAVELQNAYSNPITIHLAKDVCGAWQAASLYPHKTLQAKGDVTGDSTTLFLISQKPFNQVIEVCHAGA